MACTWNLLTQGVWQFNERPFTCESFLKLRFMTNSLWQISVFRDQKIASAPHKGQGRLGKYITEGHLKARCESLHQRILKAILTYSQIQWWWWGFYPVPDKGLHTSIGAGARTESIYLKPLSKNGRQVIIVPSSFQNPECKLSSYMAPKETNPHHLWQSILRLLESADLGRREITSCPLAYTPSHLPSWRVLQKVKSLLKNYGFAIGLKNGIIWLRLSPFYFYF